MSILKRVCVIGAGSSGIVAAKSLQQQGVPFDCFELGSGVGGVWRYDNDSGLSPAYRSLHINTSRQRMCFSDFPMPADYPDFPHHSLILRYFENYVDHFDIRRNIRFRTRVESVRPLVDGCWEVTTRQGESPSITTRYQAVIVANGHHWKPRWPNFAGEFRGRVMHSHEYRTPDDYQGQRVVVVGIGNSGCDIACELSRAADRVFLSTRRGAHVIPKYLLGKPLDHLAPSWMWRYLPFRVFQRLFEAALRISRGKLKRYGLPQPEHRILEEHPTISSDLFNQLGHGEISIKPQLTRLDHDHVEFSDGSREQVDTIIYATGYDIAFPFLRQDLLDTSDNSVRLYRRVVHPNYHNLFFVGLIQPWGAIMPLAEEQSLWVAEMLAGASGLPAQAVMDQEMDDYARKLQKRYASSPRHTIQVDFYAYLDEIRKERRLGRRYPALRLPKLIDSDAARAA
ncbi:NAD(P)-binding domain-containing protein [Blastopirellula sp. JC732]|uniref:Flavin-containing monooxygenase 5 n=1 Tax=Blastopirellula sediminis TaxID=2894196 RepID=A0A9X1MPR5_9BACT|nr:NAD(P)-binding domain-containing protein [Blastopirellula sediminis]MCC9606923.1 NAD(P)-binding domain-containing protein [Blastopirellula sediminis]MCC9629782.1 NAD(P)-binding domain-containing protein [Blastopirellula sediminis]